MEHFFSIGLKEGDYREKNSYVSSLSERKSERGSQTAMVVIERDTDVSQTQKNGLGKQKADKSF